MAIKEGAKAPDFTLLTDSGEKLKLSSLRGRNVVLYFYPKSDTPGCTTEACEFRDANAAYAQADTVVLGLSPDPVKAQTKFKTKFNLPFTLLADEDHSVCELYGTWVEKSMYGKKYWGAQRATFILDSGGKVVNVIPKVSPKKHDEQVLEALAGL